MVGTQDILSVICNVLYSVSSGTASRLLFAYYPVHIGALLSKNVDTPAHILWSGAFLWFGLYPIKVNLSSTPYSDMWDKNEQGCS